jgi:O-methyltransferase involved in polyketide biosynthesis
VWETLSFVATLPAGTKVVFDYAVPADMLTVAQRAAAGALAARVGAAGEPLTTTLRPTELARWLRGAGFGQLADMGAAELNARYFTGRTDGLAVAASARVMLAEV